MFRNIESVAFIDYEKCERFESPGKIKLDVQLNDILVCNVKHDQCYYYNDESSVFYEDLKRIVTDEKSLYKIYDSGVSRKAHYVCPTLGTYPDRVLIILDDYGIRKITLYECLALQGKVFQKFNW